MRLLFCAVLLLATLAPAQAPGTVQPSVEVAPVGPVQVHPGGIAKVELDLRVSSGFHINSNRPKSDLLIPTTLKLTAPQPLTVASVQYPPGEDQSFPFSPNEKLSVYTGDFRIDTALKAAPKAAPGSYTINGELRYQACDKRACYPPKTMPLRFQVVVK